MVLIKNHFYARMVFYVLFLNHCFYRSKRTKKAGSTGRRFLKKNMGYSKAFFYLASYRGVQHKANNFAYKNLFQRKPIGKKKISLSLFDFEKFINPRLALFRLL